MFDREAQQGCLHRVYSGYERHKAVIQQEFLCLSQPNRRRAVYGSRRVFLRLDQAHGRRRPRGRAHRRCIGCEENTRQGSSLRTPAQTMRQRPIHTLPKVHLLVRPGSHLLAPAVRFSTARRARSSQGRALLQRPPAGLGLDRPSTVLGWQEAVAMLGMVRSEIFLSCGSDRNPPGPRPAASGQAGLGRTANARRAIERASRPFGEKPPKRGLIFNGASHALRG